MANSCPAEGVPHDPHGTTVVWGGENIGMLRSFNIRAGRARPVDTTPHDAVVVGSGWESRVIRRVSVGSIEPATLSLQLYSGLYVWNHLDRGDVRPLFITGDWGNWQGDAFLADMTLSGAVGDWVVMNLEFQFTGG
jgi:hypothetical protein